MPAGTLEPLPLARGLAALALDDLAALAARLTLNDGLTSKARLLASLPAQLSDAGVVRRLTRELEAGDARTLFVAAAAEKLAPSLGPALVYRYGPTSPPPALVSRGLLLPDVAMGRYRPPAELLAAIDDEAARRLDDVETDGPAAPVWLTAGSALRDAVNIWCYVLKNALPLTQTGAAPKRALGKLLPLLEVPEEDETAAQLQEGLGFSRLELLVNEAHRRGALVAREGELRAADWLAEAMAATPETFAAELVAAALAEEGTGAGAVAAYRLHLPAAGKWAATNKLVAKVKGLIAEATPEGIRKCLACAAVAGWAGGGLNGGGEVALRWRPAAEAGAPTAAEPPPEALVGANFEVKVPASLPPADRLRLEAFADQVAGGHFLSFMITKTSFYRALDAGLAADDVVAFLAGYAGKPVPQNVAFSLRDWAAQYGVVSFSDGLMLTAASAAAADEVANLPAVAPFVRERVQLYGFRLAAGDYAAARRALLAAGYLPRSLGGRDELAVSPRALFHPTTETPAPAAAVSAAAVLEFAAANGRRVELWLKGEETPLAVAPRRVTAAGGEKYLNAEGPDGAVLIPLAAVSRATLL